MMKHLGKIILITIILTGCNATKETGTYRHLLVDEAYIKVDLKRNGIEKIKVNNMCKKIDTTYIKRGRIDTTHLFQRIDYYYYIPVTLDKLNNTKLKNKDRLNVVPQIE